MAKSVSLEQEFRQAMRQLGASVSIVTTLDQGKRRGLTVTSVCSLSMEPPGLLMCINRRSAAHDAMAGSQYFAVNVLSEEHRSLSELFAGRRTTKSGESRFEASDGEWTTGTGGVPVLQRALTSVVCERSFTNAFGTHSIIVGEVVEVRLRPVLGTPLIYADGAYRNLFPEEWLLSVV